MSRAQALFLVLACLLAAAWAARRAGPSLFADVHPPAAAAARAVPLSAHDIHSHTDRLRAYFNSPPPFTRPSRNPFRFFEPPATSAPAARARAAGAPPSSASQIERAERPEMQLVGVAEDRAADGGVLRTAIVSAMTQLFFAREGERVLGRYEVVRIGPDAAQLKGPDGETFTLALR